MEPIRHKILPKNKESLELVSRTDIILDELGRAVGTVVPTSIEMVIFIYLLAI